MINTVFKSERFDEKKGIWVPNIYFIQGPEEEFKVIDFNIDLRFCEVKDKRKKAIILGDIELRDIDFPIVFPIKLSNGVILMDNRGNIIEPEEGTTVKAVNDSTHKRVWFGGNKDIKAGWVYEPIS